MKSLLLIVSFLVLIFNLSFAQEFKIHYYPSFYNYSTYSINCKDDSCMVFFEIYDVTDASKIITYEEYIISKELVKDLFYFLDSIEKFDNKFLAFDGISVNGEYKAGPISKQIDFENPDQNTNEHHLLAMSIDLFNSSTNNKKINKYARVLKQYLK